MNPISAADVIGRQLKLKRDVTGFIGYPGSNNIVVWNSGYITPLVYSYVELNNKLYWSFWSEIQGDPIYYFPHQTGYYELLPDVKPNYSPGNNQPGFFESLGLVDFAKFTPVAKTVIFGIGGLLLYKLLKNTTK